MKALIVLLLAVTPCSFAQTTVNGSLRGTVLDPQSLAIGGASVSLENRETGFASATLTTSTGTYQFARITPGTYRVSVEKTGFKKAVRESILIPVNETVVADITLELGPTAESINVEGAASILASEHVEIAGRVDERRIRELPLNGKNLQRLVFLAPGVAGLNANLNSSANGNPSISGARPITNTYTIDGVSANDERNANGLALVGGGAAGFAGASPNLISTEAIQEFSITTANADATFGRGSGGQINVITKSGSNTIHGSAYEYLRNDALDARDFFNYGPFFDSQRRSIVPPFRQNLFGASAGGPIVRNKHFFFANYEGFRQKLEQTATATVPNGDLIRMIPGQAGRLYRLFYVDGGIVPENGIPAGASFSALSAADRNAAIAAGFPNALFDGSSANGEAGTLLLSTTNTRNVVQDSFLIRTDHRFGHRLSTNFRYAFASPTLEANTRAVAGVLQQNRRRWQSALAQTVYTISANQILEVRGGLQRSAQRDRPRDPVSPALVAFGIDPQLGLQSIVNGTALSTMQIVGSAGFLDNQTVPQLAVQHTYSRGAMTLRSGIDVRHLNLNLLQISNAPFFQFGGFIGATGLLGSQFGQAETVMSQASATIYGTNGGPTTPQRGWRATEQEYYSQLDWRPRRDLSFNLGIRYSYFGTYREVGNFMGNLYAVDPGGKIVDDVHPFQYGRLSNTFLPVTSERPFVHADPTNVQPRLGAAWNIGSRGTTVLRAAYGMYADRFTQRMYDQGVLNPPYAYSAVFTNIVFPSRAQLPVTSSPAPQLRTVDPSLRSPRTSRFNFAAEQKIAANTSITLAYVGLRAWNLFRYEEPNGQGAWPQEARPDQRFARQRFLNNTASSSYDSLQIFARHRYSHGVDFTLAYTYGRSLDTYSNDAGDTQFPSLINLGASAAPGFQGGGTAVAPRPVLADKGYSDFDLRHSLIISHIVELPFGRGRHFGKDAGRLFQFLAGGFSLAGIVTLRSGIPANVITGQDYNDIGDTTQNRPALISGSPGDLYSDGSAGKTQYFVSQVQARTILGIPANVVDPYAAIRRNSLSGPPVRVYDLSLLKAFHVSDTIQLKAEANAFNVFNHENFDSPVLLLSDVRFGRVIATRSGTNPRQLQLGLKLTF